MPRPVPYLFCRYNLFIDDDILDPGRHFDALDQLKGKRVAHWKARPTPEDFDTFLFRLKRHEFNGWEVLTWTVGQQIGDREMAIYDPKTDNLVKDTVRDESIRYANFVAVPSVSALAVNDVQGGIHLGGQQATRRFKSVFQSLENCEAEADIRLTLTPEETEKALESWDLHEFSYTVRPFNPHPGRMGQKLHNMLVSDGAGQSRGVIKPVPGQKMHPGDKGFIKEAVGMADDGYGQYAIKGTTPDGKTAAIKKPKFKLRPEKNIEQQEKPRALRVDFDPDDDEQARNQAIAAALVEFYG